MIGGQQIKCVALQWECCTNTKVCLVKKVGVAIKPIQNCFKTYAPIKRMALEISKSGSR